jgi:hypothetical protein
MSTAKGKCHRSWQEIAAEASQEQDSKKLVELVEELERALDAGAARSKPVHEATQ